MSARRIVSHEEWVAARKDLLEHEKAFTRQRDELSRRLRDLPWERDEDNLAFTMEWIRHRDCY